MREGKSRHINFNHTSNVIFSVKGKKYIPYLDDNSWFATTTTSENYQKVIAIGNFVPYPRKYKIDGNLR